MKVGKIMGCLKISSADSPRVRGGRSAIHEAVHQRLCREVLNLKNTLRTVRQRTADGPPVLGRICQKQCQSSCSVKNSKADGPLGYSGQSANGQKGGVGQTLLI